MVSARPEKIDLEPTAVCIAGNRLDCDFVKSAGDREATCGCSRWCSLQPLMPRCGVDEVFGAG